MLGRRSAVSPAFASAITCDQLTMPPALVSARCAGVRATSARNLALYDRAILMKSARLITRPLIQRLATLGRNVLISAVAVAVLAMAIAESTYPSAAAF